MLKLYGYRSRFLLLIFIKFFHTLSQSYTTSMWTPVFVVFGCICVCISQVQSTLAPDYIFYVGSNDTFVYNQRFGCDTAGCDVTKTWQIVGICINPSIALSIIEGDFLQDSEKVFISINNKDIGNCDELISDCTHDWVHCGAIDDYYENTSHLGNGTQITVTLDATNSVDYCPYEVNTLVIMCGLN